MSQLWDGWLALEPHLREEYASKPVDTDVMTDLFRLSREAKHVAAMSPAQAPAPDRDEARWIERAISAFIAGDRIPDLPLPASRTGDAMSTTRKIHAPDGDERSASHLSVTRFSMGERGLGLQLTIRGEHVRLTPEQRLEFYAVLGELFGTTPPADAGALKLSGPAQVITRDELLTFLRHEADQPLGLREWLTSRFAITEKDLTNWMTVTLSRDAVRYLMTRHSGPRMALDDRTAALANEVMQALANAKPEEDE